MPLVLLSLPVVIKHFSSPLYTPFLPNWAPDRDDSLEGTSAKIKEPVPTEASVNLMNLY